MNRWVGILVALACLLGASAAAASWNGAGGGSGYTKASSLSAGNVPATSVSGRNVAVSWTAPSGGAPIEGYTVSRYSTGGAAQSVNSNCNGTISGLSCTEQGVPSGTWTYTVTPRKGNWRGAESAASSPTTVGAANLQLSGSTTLSSLPGTLNGSISNYVAGQTVTFRLDDPNTGQSVSGSISPSPTPNNGQADVSVTIPSGTANGSHTLYAIGSEGDVASATFTVAVPTRMTTSAWNLRDASSGINFDASDFTAFNDGRAAPSGSLPTTFSASRYLQFDLNAPLAPEKTTSSVNLNFRFAAATSGRTGCFYFEVRRASTGAVLATHGSATSPVGCNSTTTQQTFTTALPSVTSSGIANDLRIRIFATESGGGSVNIDLATVSGTSAASPFTLHDTVWVNAASGTPITMPWGIAAAGDGANYASFANWTTAFASTRYLSMTFPSYVPAGAAIDAVTFKHAYRSATTGTTCYYLEVYSGATLLGTHGSASAPISCNATTSYVTDSIALPEVTSAAQANNLTVKLYVRNSGALKSQDDLDTLTIDYVE